MNNYGRPYSDGSFQAPIPASVAERLLDTDRIADLVHQAELQEIALTAEQKIKEVVTKDGYEQTVDGVALVLSNSYVTGRSQDGRSVYARLYTTTNTDEPARSGILFDVTPDKAIVTTNLDGITVSDGSIVVGSEFNAGIEVDPKEEVYRYVSDVVNALWKDVTRKEEREIEKQNDDKIHRQHEKEWERARRSRNVRLFFDEFGILLVPLGVAGVGAAAITFAALASGELPAITDEPAVITVGNQASPTFSRQLYESDELKTDVIYNLPSNSFATGEVRQFELVSSKPGKNCEAKSFDENSRPALTSEVKAWTDAVNPNGTPRNGEIVVTFTLDEIKACWVKDTEQNEDDDVRVVVQLTDPAAPATGE